LAVCDATRIDTLYDLVDWIKAVHKIAGPIPIEFLCNKVDLFDRISVKDSHMKELAQAYRSPYMLTSAKTGKNVPQAFRELSERILMESD